MANRHRDLAAAHVERENIRINPAKAAVREPPSRRPALNDLGNKLGHKPATKAPSPKKENVPPSHSYSSSQIARIDQDADIKQDPQMVPEYVVDIYKYLREQEKKYVVNEAFLEGHKTSARMRTILTNWLVEINANFSCCLETLHMSVSITDRYLQEHKGVGMQTLQLVGTTALFIACKYEEICVPALTDFVYICDDSFTASQILKMEISILKTLDFNLGMPLSIHFLRRYSKLAKVSKEQHNFGKYVLELALLDHTMSSVLPSLQAVAACYMSLVVFKSPIVTTKVWTPQLALGTGYTYVEFKHVVCQLAKLVLKTETSKTTYIKRKYSDAAHDKVSINPKMKGPLMKKLATPT